jgi:plastocyanin
MLATLAAVLLLCSVPADAARRAVSVRNDFFSPRKVTVAVGDKVRWIWRSGGRPHNVVSPSFGDSGVRARGSFTVSFRRAGRFRYVCMLHAGMTGTVVVRRR